MELLQSLATSPFVWGLLLGLLFFVLSFLGHVKTKAELKRFQKMLSDKMEIEANLIEQTKKGKEAIAKENENLRVRIAQLQEKPDAKIARDLEILARAEKAMIVNAPGFAPAWENAKSAAAEEVSLEDQGKSLPKRLFHRLFGAGEMKAIEAETADEPARAGASSSAEDS